LKGLAQLRINTDNTGRPVLGDRKNVQGGGNNGGDLLLKKPGPADVVVISDSERSPGGHGPVDRYDKAARLIKLTQAAGKAADNRVLAHLTEDFVKVLRNSNSRTLTREGFAFLDALHKQLADPSVFIVPLRSSRARSQRDQESPVVAEEAPRERRSRLSGLCMSLVKAQDNKTVAGLVAEFGALIDKTAGRKLTKDGMSFLDIVADRLLVVRV
jgi:casein kinase 1